MMRRAATAPIGALYAATGPEPIIQIGVQQMTVALFGLAIYLFCVHSFKLPIAAVGIAIGLLGVLLNPNHLRFPPPLVFMAVFLGWCAVTATMSVYKSVVGDTLMDYAKILLIFFVAINACRSLPQLGIFAGLWVLMFGLYPARGTFFNFLAGIGNFGRYGWNFSFGNYNDLAAYAILALALSAFLLAGRYPKWVRIGALASTVGLTLLVILTQSRGAFLGLIIGFGLMIVRSRSKARLLRFGAIAVTVVTLAAPQAVWSRFSAMKYLLNTDTIGEADSSAEQRYILLQIAMQIARDNPVHGVGLGAYADAHGFYAESRPEWAFGRGNRDAHNMYVNLAAETGIPGLVLFLLMLGSALLHAMRTETKIRVIRPLEAEQLRILRFGLIAYLVAAIFGSFHRSSFLYLFIAVLWSASTLFLRLPGPAESDSGSRLPTPSRWQRGWRSVGVRRAVRVG